MSTDSSITYEPNNPADLATFLVDNKEKHHEIWVILIKKKYVNPQPVSFNQAVNLAINNGLVDSRTNS
jgi:hypothetical protein